MPKVAIAKKRAKQAVKRGARNTAHNSRMRSRIRKVDEAVAAGDVDAATTALSAAESELAQAGRRGLVHRKTAARKTSRLNAKVRALKA